MKKIKTADAVNAFSLIAEAKLTKMDDADKFLVIKAARKLKPVVTAFEDFRKDAGERLKDEDYGAMMRKVAQWQKEGTETTLTETERMEINNYFMGYNHKVEECVREEAEKMNKMDYKPLSEEAMEKLFASNDWTVSQLMAVGDVLS